MKRLLALALACVGLVAASKAIGGYSYSGHRWPGNDVPYFVNPASRWLTESQILAALQAAAGHWTSQSGANIRYTYAGRTSGSSLINNGINEVFFRNTTNGSLGGATYYWYGGDGKLLDADTVFYEALYRFYPGSSGCTGTNSHYLEDVATHEFGHALGLNHSGDATATMYPTMSLWCSQSWRTLSSDDIAGIRAAYPATTATVPAAPSSLTARLGTSATSEVQLAWSDRSTNESAFVIQRSLNGSTFSQSGQVAAGIIAYKDTALTAGTTYWYRVYAVNATGPSGYSNTVAITTQNVVTSAPSAPSGASPANGATNVQTTKIAWAASANAQKYDVYFGTSPTPARVAAGISATSWSVGSLGVGVRYYWRVVAINSVGSTSGPTWSFTTRAKGKR
jgi:hypothetical protein